MAERPSRYERRKPQDPVTRRDEALAFVATDDTWQPPDWFGRLCVVLVEPTNPVNIGGVIRAMANTGFLNLRLVRPVGFDPWHVAGIAHYTQHIVAGTQQYESLPVAVQDQHLVLGLTGKHHRLGRNVLTLPEAVNRLVAAAQSGQRVALLFGREDWGLSNDMLDACHMVTTIPTNPGYPSLNLAQAALLVLYQVFQRAGGQEQSFRPSRRRAVPAPAGLLEDLFADLERGLDAIEFLKSRSRRNTLRAVRIALYRARLDTREAALLRAVFIEVRRFLKRKGVLAEVGPVGSAQPADLTHPQGSGTLNPGPTETSPPPDRSKPPG